MESNKVKTIYIGKEGDANGLIRTDAGNLIRRMFEVTNCTKYMTNAGEYNIHIKLVNEVVDYLIHMRTIGQVDRIPVSSIVAHLGNSEYFNSVFGGNLMYDYLMCEQMIDAFNMVVSEDRCIGLFDSRTREVKLYPNNSMDKVVNYIGTANLEYIAIFVNAINIEDYDIVNKASMGSLTFRLISNNGGVLRL